MARRHLIVSGTGRAGTTFLMQLFTKLGLDTGFSNPNDGLFANCNAGMETDINRPDAPYIIKSPWLCDRLDELCESGQVVVDHVIVPIRELHAAAQSRIEVERATPPGARVEGWPVPGGLWDTCDPQSQRWILAEKLYGLFHAIVKHDLPMTLLSFPRLVQDAPYLYRKLRFMLGQTDERQFLDAFRALSRPELVHDFKAEEARRSA